MTVSYIKKKLSGLIRFYLTPPFECFLIVISNEDDFKLFKNFNSAVKNETNK